MKIKSSFPVFRHGNCVHGSPRGPDVPQIKLCTADQTKYVPQIKLKKLVNWQLSTGNSGPWGDSGLRLCCCSMVIYHITYLTPPTYYVHLARFSVPVYICTEACCRYRSKDCALCTKSTSTSRRICCFSRLRLCGGCRLPSILIFNDSDNIGHAGPLEQYTICSQPLDQTMKNRRDPSHEHVHASRISNLKS